MKATMSSLRPLGARSDSMSVMKPYLYLSTSISLTSSIVSVSAIFFFLCRFPPGDELRPGGDELFNVLWRRRPAQADADGGACEIGRNAHRRQHMRFRHLAGRAGRARGNGKTGKVERHERRFGGKSRHGEATGIGQPLGLSAKDLRAFKPQFKIVT